MPPDGERGAFMVLWALLLVGLITMMAIVVDLGHLREARATTQSVADMAALAAGEHLASLSSPDPQEGCYDAVRFIRMNVPDMPAAMSVPCDDLPEPCLETTPKAVVTDQGTAGKYRVEITFPVPDADIHDGRTALGLRNDDGHPCERMRVDIQRTNDGYFTGVLGVNQLSTSASAVVRRKPPEVSRIPNLWLLDPTGCPALDTQGGANLLVGSRDLDLSGLITIDSDGSDTGSGGSCRNKRTIDASGSSTVTVTPVSMSLLDNPLQLDPPGEISLHAMWPGQTTCAEGNPTACDATQVSTGKVRPQPIRREQRATRAIVDHRYNCRYGGQGQWHDPSRQYGPYPADINVTKIPIADCTDADGQPFIDQLRVGAGPVGTKPPGAFQRWTESFSCSDPTAAADFPAKLPGNWWIDCPGGFDLTEGVVDFTGGNIVFDGTLRMGGGAELRINSGDTDAPEVVDRTMPSHCLATVTGCLDQSSPGAAFVYLRNGNIRFTAQAKITVTNAAVVQDGGFLRMSGQAPPVWSAPLEGPFAGLSLWSELADSSNYIINGGSGMELQGVFFTPQAVFTINGGGEMKPQQAQFIAYRLKLAGSGTLELKPDGLNALSLPPPVAALIR